jgi:hypothetical protein
MYHVGQSGSPVHNLTQKKKKTTAIDSKSGGTKLSMQKKKKYVQRLTKCYDDMGS